MWKRLHLEQFDDFWKPQTARSISGSYFCRIAGYSPALQAFLLQAVEKRRTLPLRMTGKLQNPEEQQLSYLREVLGTDFQCNPDFFASALQKWLPRLPQPQRLQIAQSIYKTLQQLQAQGKNTHMLCNAYVKFMCWMYYRFEQLLHHLGQENPPRILYDGVLSAHEFQLFCILVDAGCDVLLIEQAGDAAYQKLDPQGIQASLCTWAGNAPFPSSFSLEALCKQPVPAKPVSRTPETLFPNAPKIVTNTWLSDDYMADSLKSPEMRGENPTDCYNLFVRILGVADKSAYIRDLFLWRKRLEATGRHVTVLESLPIPTPDETARIPRKTPQSAEQVLSILLPSLHPTANSKLDAAAGRALATVLLSCKEDTPNRLLNKGIYLVCWFNRYFRTLFEGYTSGKLPIFIYFGLCHTSFEALFLQFLARLPLDVLEIYPQHGCVLEDSLLSDRTYPDTLSLDKFPISADDAAYSTVAYHAEQELTDVLYQDSGLYRPRQHTHATAISLQTMCEEVYLLWEQEATYRPGFETIEDTVLVPVLTAKISGVPHEDVNAYWAQIKKMTGPNVLCITRQPYFELTALPAFQPTAFLKNRKILQQQLMQHSAYPYRLLRPEIQAFLLEKVQLLLDSGLIQGTFSQGMEYKILSIAMQLPQEVVRILQKIDFTKEVPKVLLIATKEVACSLEDSILLALLHFLCFDVVLFVPTGYQVIEMYYTEPFFTEHQAGGYVYDLQPPYLTAQSHSDNFFTRFFRRGHT